jgi:hypothetical protein
LPAQKDVRMQIRDTEIKKPGIQGRFRLRVQKE